MSMQLVLLATGCGPVAQSCPNCEQTTATDPLRRNPEAEVTGWSGRSYCHLRKPKAGIQNSARLPLNIVSQEHSINHLSSPSSRHLDESALRPHPAVALGRLQRQP
jgi:hypothetical protein